MKPIKSRKLPIMTLRFLLVLVAISLFGSRVHAMPEMYFVHSDHLGTPQVLTDKNQEVVWERSHTPFGETVKQSGTVIQPLRFPGQYEDTETGLYYNYYTDYDPMLGRFVQSDPIGLNGGLNTYAYVGGNPTRYTDPKGLVRWEGTYRVMSAAAPVGATIGFFDLRSECVNGIQSTAEVMYSGPAGAIGAKVTGSEGDIAFEDHHDSVKPWVLQGPAGMLGASAQVGPVGADAGKIVLGDAYQRPVEGGERCAVDLGAGVSFGSSTLTDFSVSRCGCNE